jgi:hypothetical protein
MLTPEQIISTVADYFNIEVSELKSPVNYRRIIEPRFAAIYFLKTRLNMSLTSMAKEVSSGGPFRHSTIHYALKKVNNWIETDPIYRGYIQDINDRLYENVIKAKDEVFQESDFFAEQINEGVKLPTFDHIQPVNGRGYSGFREHQL